MRGLKWVTRKFVHIDRTACPWLIRKFIDREAEFEFIDWPGPLPDEGTPFDIPGVELGHHGNKCSFETIVEKYGIEDPIVHEVARVIHAADVQGEEHKAPEAPGILAIFGGLRMISEGDEESIEIGGKIWDSLYAFFLLKRIREEHEEELSKMGRMERLRFLRKEVNEGMPK